jgi:nicotinamidase-related amidase
MDEVTCAARRQGVLVIHAPSDTLAFYAESPARRRVLDLPKVEPPPDLPHEDPPIAVQTHDPTSCDTPPDKPRRTWSRQHPAITIDESLDLVSDNGRELYSVYQTRGIRHVIILGVHTNMCVLNRSFGIKQLVRWGFDTTLVRDLTDAQYSPAQAPYVPHEEGTRLVVEYIEKFWCPTIHSDDLLK